MAGLRVTAFAPDAWIELRALLPDLVPDGAGLHRRDGWRSEDGARLRSATVVRNEDGAAIEALAAFALEREAPPPRGARPREPRHVLR